MEELVTSSNVFYTILVLYLGYSGKILHGIDKSMVAVRIKVKHAEDDIKDNKRDIGYLREHRHEDANKLNACYGDLQLRDKR